jgi:hypothetical protein
VPAVLLSAAAFAYANLAGGVEAPKQSPKKYAVTVKGHVDDLHPGVTTKLEAKVRNNLVNRVELRGVKTKVGDASADCPRTLLTADEVRLKKGIPPRESRPVKIPVTLSGGAPDGCQKVSFPLEFEASAQRRDGTF